MTISGVSPNVEKYPNTAIITQKNTTTIVLLVTIFIPRLLIGFTSSEYIGKS